MRDTKIPKKVLKKQMWDQKKEKAEDIGLQ